MSCNFCLFFNFFVPKAYVLKVLDGTLFIRTLWVFLLGLSNFKMTLATLNTSFHIDLGRFIGDCVTKKRGSGNLTTHVLSSVDPGVHALQIDLTLTDTSTSPKLVHAFLISLILNDSKTD